MIKFTSIKSLLPLLPFILFIHAEAQLSSNRMADPIPSEVNIMYQKGVRYLINSQTEEGNWLDAMGREPGVVALALLSVIASDTQSTKATQTFKKNCLDYILEQQDTSSGYIGNSMYNHGFATLALAESYGQIPYKNLGVSLEKATTLILSAQEFNPTGGWRYTPESIEADSTVTGCQLVALLAARNAGITVPDSAIEKGLTYLKTCRTKDGSYGYTDAYNGKPTLTAIALLSHYLSKTKPTEETNQSLEHLKKRLNYRDQHYPFYYEYYMSQALFQAAPETWEEWNLKNIRFLKVTQTSDGSWEGNHGKAYSTAAALLSLALNYRFMPIYERF